MKKLCLLLVFNLTLTVCYAQHFDRLVISCFEFCPSHSLQSKSMLEVYDVQICIKNVSNSPILFWSWHNRWFDNFRFTNNNIYFIDRFISDAPACILILPHLTIRYKGQVYFQNQVYSRNTDFKYLFKSQEILFLFYDALKYSKEDYLSRYYILTNPVKRKYNEFPIIADTIRCEKTVMFQLLDPSRYVLP